MCGIALLIDAGATASALRRDLDLMYPGIASRGPDGVHVHLDAGVGFLHTRLAVIDLVTGDQPVWNETGDIACIYNGEIYNHRELRTSLIHRGHRFATKTDTEVLVHLYEDHGAQLVTHIHGMYAFALFDRRRRLVVVGRDGFGIKPLYVARIGNRIAFSSAIRSLLAVGAASEPDPVALAQYLRFHSVPEPRTAFRGISAFPPGHFGVIDVTAGTLSVQRFFRPRKPMARVPDPNEAEARARAAFETAVSTHMVADVEVAAFLSGGIDSSLVVAQAQRLSSRPLRTFCVSFPHHGTHNEATFAERVASALGTRHETVEAVPAPTELVRAAVAAAQQPFAIASMLPLLMLTSTASKHVKVVLTGDGGDEVAFGYPTYRWMRSTAHFRARRFPPSLAHAMEVVERSATRVRPVRRAAKFLRGALVGDAAGAEVWRYNLSPSEAVALLNPELGTVPLDQPTPIATEWETGIAPVDALRYADLQVSLRDEMLPKVDRAGMAHGLEARVPLLDDAFVDSMLKIPAKQHMAGGVPKAILRRWAHELVPGIDAKRPKHGFDVPIQAWLQGSLLGDVRRLLLETTRPRLLNVGAVRRLWRKATLGVPGAAHDVYAALVLELWYEEGQRV